MFSHAPPVHLLTREAFQLYRSRLEPTGLLVVDCTNRTMDLLPVLARIAEAGDNVTIFIEAIVQGSGKDFRLGKILTQGANTLRRG